jgi:transcriptional regulator with XRE-family HTH domain
MLVDPKKVVNLRTARAWTQERLAFVANVSLRTIQRLESGKEVSAETILAVAKALDVRPEDLRPNNRQTSADAVEHTPHGDFLPRILTGTELRNIIADAEMYAFDHDDPKTAEEAEMLGQFFQLLQDMGDLWSDLEMSDRVRIGFELQQYLDDLHQLKFWVFGKAVQKRYRVGAIPEPITFRTAVIRVVRENNPEIIQRANTGATMYQKA